VHDVPAGGAPAPTAITEVILRVTLRGATTPALTRALRAGTLDLAILARTPPFRPPDSESPPLELTTLAERELMLGVPANHPFARAQAVEVAASRDP
jgi:DNA-binding transcriptional LysR family regulator